MTWNAPPPVSAGDVASATNYNVYVKDNLLYLFNGRPTASILRVGGADYATTATSFVDVDAANLTLTVLVNTGRVRVLAFGRAWLGYSSAGTAFGAVDLLLDGATRGNAANTNGLVYLNSISQEYQWMVCAEFTGLTVGTHQIKPIYSLIPGGTALGQSINIRNNGIPIGLYAQEF